MKKFYILFATICFSAVFAQAQFLMKSNSHILRAGDEHYFNITNNVGPGADGSSVLWDFSSLQNQSTLTSHMYSAYETEFAADIPEANTVLEEFGNKFFFKASEGIIEQYGTVTNNNTITKFDKPFVKMIFPFNFGDTYSGDFSGTIDGANNYHAVFNGTYSLEVDAFGTLILPGNIKFKNVLRVKTIKKQFYNNNECNCSTISYKWYSKDVRYPLLTIIQNQNGQEINTIQTAYYSKGQNVTERTEESKSKLSESLDGKIFPNPFNSEFKLDYTLTNNCDVQVEIYDNNGKKVYSVQKLNQKAGSYSQSFNSEELGNQLGIFHIRLVAGSESISRTVIRGE